MREHIVVPAIRSREVAWAQRSVVRHCEDALKVLDFSNAPFSVHPSQYPIERQAGQFGAASSETATARFRPASNDSPAPASDLCPGTALYIVGVFYVITDPAIHHISDTARCAAVDRARGNRAEERSVRRSLRTTAGRRAGRTDRQGYAIPRKALVVMGNTNLPLRPNHQRADSSVGLVTTNAHQARYRLERVQLPNHDAMPTYRDRSLCIATRLAPT